MVQRVGILTLPLSINYGGIMQAVALGHHLRSLGYDVILLDKRRPLGFVQRLGLAMLEIIPFQNIVGARRRKQARRIHDTFIGKFIPTRTPALRSEWELTRAASEYRLDAVIVGSDQVWRMDYLHDDGYREFFLSFVTSADIRRIAYAASFGTREWRHADRTVSIRDLLSKFDAISVREDSGVILCETIFGMTGCEQVLDPTLLVDPAFYDAITTSDRNAKGKSFLTYLLDMANQEPLAAAAAALGPDYLMTTWKLKRGKIADIPSWLQAFRDADYIMTDSFHGTVFAIIFRKPFIAIANAERGIDRFLSLLAALGLSERLIQIGELDRVEELIANHIDYNEVHHKLANLREHSQAFLKRALS